MTSRTIPEIAGPHRLGRHVNHDERSREYPVARFLAARPVQTVQWSRLVPIYDQGDLGSCTAEAVCGAVSTRPFTRRIKTQQIVRRVYHDETIIDPFEGTWPPDDTGSDGLSACKIAAQRKWIKGYAHAFSFDAVLQALQHGPVITGLPWHEGMFTPDSAGLVTVSGPVVGGHELCLTGVDVEGRRLLFANSWGPGWGHAGYGLFTFDDYAALLADDGDATVPLRSAA